MIEKLDVADFSAYNEGMRKSMYDKLFFVDKIDADVIVDFGCADGTLINFMRLLFPEYTYIGYDISDDMIKAANENNNDLTIYTSSWSMVEDILKSSRKSSLILSSVIHEVYSYGTTEDVYKFWDRVFKTGFDYIVIRDMVPSCSINKRSSINDVVRIYRSADKHQLYDFETTWGSIEENKNLVHYLLKYRYHDNWAREVKENYMPIFREDLLATIPSTYRVTYHDHYVHPFTQRQVLEDFGISMKDNTHLKLKLEKV
jgi:SAM-dependent methyltransferase